SMLLEGLRVTILPVTEELRESELKEIQHDLEAEMETLPPPTLQDTLATAEDIADAAGIPGALEALAAAVKSASKGIADETEAQYHQYALLCMQSHVLLTAQHPSLASKCSEFL
ncbi:hypothetical protein C0991_006456, partial [Blastosporella zonata]